MVRLNCSATRDEDVLSNSFSFVSDLHKYERWQSSADEEDEYTGYGQIQKRSKSPVGLWLSSIRDSTEVESLSALQAKSVAITEEAFEALSIRNAQVAISRTRKESASIMDGLDNLIDQLPLTIEDLKLFRNDFNLVSSRTYSLVETCRRRGCDVQAENDRKTLSVEVFNICQQMVKNVDDFMMSHQVNNAQLEATLRKQKERLGELVNCTIRRDCQIIVAALRYPWGSICSKWSLLALWQLTQNDAYICRIFVESRTVIPRLVRMACTGCGLTAHHSNYQQKAAALRVLTYMSVNQDAIEQIFCELEAGANIVNLLSWERNDVVLKEAIGLLVQITLPFIDMKKRTKDNSNKKQDMLRGVPLMSLVRALTNVARSPCGRELFLLVTAALANISFLECDSFRDNETCSVLVGASKQRPSLVDDVPLKDQIITVLANVAAHHPLEIISSGGLMYLLNALQLRPDESTDAVAVERIQQKTAAALARLGQHKSWAKLLERLNGIQRLVELCKIPKLRNYSDTVLLAALAALRRISSSVGKVPFKQLNALDLVELELCDSFVLYSYKSESYV